MKKIYSVVIILLLAFSANAQILSFEDSEFKETLLNSSTSVNIAQNIFGQNISIDTNNDDEIQITEIQSVYKLNIDNDDIVSIEGIDGFINLNYLTLSSESITNLDISELDNLKNAVLTGNVLLTTINASGCDNLEQIGLPASIVDLDLSDCVSIESIALPSSLANYNFGGCTGLSSISCDNNIPIVSFDFSEIPSLKHFSWTSGNLTSLEFGEGHMIESIMVPGNEITDFTVTGLNSLTGLGLHYNPIETLSITDCNSLVTFSLDGTPLANLIIENCPNLYQLFLENNELVDLSLINVPLLETINVSFNNFSTLSLGLEALKNLYIFDNQLTALDVSACPSLEVLWVYNNNLTNLNISFCTNMLTLDCNNNQLTSLDVSDLVTLMTFDCHDNFLSNIDLTNMNLLSTFAGGNNNFTSLDFSNSPDLSFADIDFSQQLEYINFKNEGNPLFGFEIQDCPELVSICADEQDFELINNYLEYYEISAAVDSTCSFEPTNDYNSITGIIRFDDNTDGCDSTDSIFADMKFTVQRDEEEAFIFSNTEGNYVAYAIEGIETVTITPELESDLFNVTPSSVTETFTSTGNTITADFCITPNGIHPDLDVALLPIFDARPGFDATYQLIVTNKGNQVQSGSVMLAYNDAVIDFTTASLAPANSNIGNLTWDFIGLAPFNTIIIDLTFNVNTPQEEPAVNVGDILPFTASITTTETDDSPEDNIYEFNQIVIGAIDPNDKQVAEGTAITPDQTGEYLHYLIRFQNTGTAEAINIRVKDVLADNLNWDTFQPISASHEYRATLTEGNIAEFFFDNIWLPAEEDNEPESHGFVSFKIKPVAGAVLGDAFENTAEIYFDFESAIITNTIVTTVEETAGIDGIDNSFFMLYPNPAKDMVYITPKQEIAIESVTIHNLLGQEIMGIKTASTVDAITLDVAGLQAGHYLIEVKTEKGRAVQKLIKQ